MFCKNVYYINGVGVNISQYSNVSVDRTAYRKLIGVEDDKIMILSVGELSERKNHKVIIDAISTLDNKDDFVYVICGGGIDGGTHDLLESRAKEKNVNLKLLGFRYDIPEINFVADIGAIPSQREGLGLAGIQSLAAGIPLVASRVQGIKDYVIDGKTGYTYRPDDVEGFAQGIKLLSSRETRMKMLNDCISMANQFSMEVSTAQMEKIYSQIISLD